MNSNEKYIKTDLSYICDYYKYMYLYWDDLDKDSYPYFTIRFNEMDWNSGTKETNVITVSENRLYDYENVKYVSLFETFKTLGHAWCY